MAIEELNVLMVEVQMFGDEICCAACECRMYLDMPGKRTHMHPGDFILLTKVTVEYNCPLDNDAGRLALQSSTHFPLTQTVRTSHNERGPKRKRKEVNEKKRGRQ